MKQQGKNNPELTEEEQLAQDFPGYPPYPPEDDIVRNGTRVEGNLGDDGFEEPNLKAGSTPQQPADPKAIAANTEPEPSEFDVTEEDLEALGPIDLSLDMGEDEQLKQRTNPVDFAANDLDVPGSDDDDTQENVGSEDEENNSYSLGGDGHSDLEEGRQ